MFMHHDCPHWPDLTMPRHLTARRLTSRRPTTERGAVLLLALIMLAVFSVLSVSAARTGMWNEQMAANYSNHETAFQLAESAGPYSLEQTTWVNEALRRIDEANNVVGTFTVPVPNSAHSVSVSLQADKVLMPGYSLLVNGGARFVQLQTDSSASVDSATATKLVQGFVRAGAG
jgi:Tfp pilus assembly protein PilX